MLSVAAAINSMRFAMELTTPPSYRRQPHQTLTLLIMTPPLSCPRDVRLVLLSLRTGLAVPPSPSIASAQVLSIMSKHFPLPCFTPTHALVAPCMSLACHHLFSPACLRVILFMYTRHDHEYGRERAKSSAGSVVAVRSMDRVSKSPYDNNP